MPKRVRLAFMTFTFSAVIVAWLAARAEQRRLEALAGRREIERLYQQLQIGVRSRKRGRGGPAERTAQGRPARRADP